MKWKTEEGSCKIKLSNTMVVLDLAMSLLSIPSLVKKIIAVFFLPGKAILIDLEDEYSILGYATQDKDGLFYIDENQSDVPTFDTNTTFPFKAMMAVVKKHSSNSQPVSEIKWKDDAEIWHRRLGHVKSKAEISTLVNRGKQPHVNTRIENCETCGKGKFRQTFKGSITKATEIGCLHVDTRGKSKQLQSMDITFSSQ